MHHHISTTDPEMEHYHCSLKSFDKIREENAAQIVLLYPSYYLLFRNTSLPIYLFTSWLSSLFSKQRVTLQLPPGLLPM